MKRAVLIEFHSDGDIDLDNVVREIDNAIFNADDTGVKTWTVEEVEVVDEDEVQQ